MKYLMKLHYKKGFTLVECIIAIAVFAVLTSMVVMIMGNAVNVTKKSQDAETGLNEIVQGVVQDDSRRVYGNDSHTLEMDFDGASSPNFRVTYSTVDGYNNYIKCPLCGETASFREYLGYIYDLAEYKAQSDTDKEKYDILYYFDNLTTAHTFVCPKCGKGFLPTLVDARCESCYRTGTLDTFHYNDSNGKYACPDCKSEVVVQIVPHKNPDGSVDPTIIEPVTDALSLQSGFMVSGIAANAIRYGKVEQLKEKDKIIELTKLSGGKTTSKANVTIEYKPNKNASKPGVYVAKFSFTDTDASNAITVMLKTPGNYICRIVGGTADGDETIGHATSYVAGVTDYSKTDGYPTLTVSNVKPTTSGNVTVEFTLTNYMNGNSFEDDYREEAKITGSDVALTKFWYASSSTTIQTPRQESSIQLLS